MAQSGNFSSDSVSTGSQSSSRAPSFVGSVLNTARDLVLGKSSSPDSAAPCTVDFVLSGNLVIIQWHGTAQRVVLRASAPSWQHPTEVSMLCLTTGHFEYRIASVPGLELQFFADGERCSVPCEYINSKGEVVVAPPMSVSAVRPQATSKAAPTPPTPASPTRTPKAAPTTSQTKNDVNAIDSLLPGAGVAPPAPPASKLPASFSFAAASTPLPPKASVAPQPAKQPRGQSMIMQNYRPQEDDTVDLLNPAALKPPLEEPVPRPAPRKAKTVTRHDFAAAGVTFVRAAPAGAEVLLGYEDRHSSKLELHPIGGKRSGKETAAETAARETWEELGRPGALRDALKDAVQKFGINVIFYPGKYILFIIPLMYDMGDKLTSYFRPNEEVTDCRWCALDTIYSAGADSAYSSMTRAMFNSPNVRSAIKSSLLQPSWAVPGTLQAPARNQGSALQQPSAVTPPFGFWNAAFLPETPEMSDSSEKTIGTVITSGQTTTWAGGALPISTTKASVASAAAAEAAARSAVTRKQVLKRASEILAEVEDALSGDNDHFLSRFRRGMKLSLAAPSVTVKPPIDTIMPTDKRFAPLITANNLSGTNFACVREVSVPLQKQRFEAYIAGSGELPMPIWHGTPDEWRATAIAQNGFNFNTIINGSKYGVGVYTAQSTATCMGYAGAKGSILRLRGSASTKDFKKHETDWYVFSAAQAVLPTHIFDQTMPAGAAPSAQRAACKELESEMADNVKRFGDQVVRTWKPVFQRFRDSLRAQIAALKADDDESIVAELATLLPAFAHRLPVFLHYQSIMDAISTERVMILQAGTGVGKSTVVPQLCVNRPGVPATKGVLVLEPRRATTINLANRIAADRGCAVGTEVGFELGGGVSFVGQSTRIHFMTHGLFCMRSKTHGFFQRYHTIVADEVHERTLDTVCALAHLRTAIAKHPELHVVAMSATLADNGEAIGRYLLGGTDIGTLPKTLELKGTQYPVAVSWRSLEEIGCATTDDSGRPAALGSDLAKAFLQSSAAVQNYAVQLVLNILRDTPSGNIMLFLPTISATRTALKVIAGLEGYTVQSNHGNDAFVSIGPQKKGLAGFTFTSQLTAAETRAAMSPPGNARAVYVVTPSAEVGVTLPDVRYVVDTGLCFCSQWDYERGLSTGSTALISKASMEQRRGRAGRTASGVCFRIYPQELVAEMPDCAPPATAANNVASLLLAMAAGAGTSRTLSLLDEVPEDAQRAAEAWLISKGLVDGTGHITDHGRNVSAVGDNNLSNAIMLLCAAQQGAASTAAWALAGLRSDSESLINAAREHGAAAHPPATSDYTAMASFCKEYTSQRIEEAPQWCVDHSVSTEIMELTAQQHSQTILRLIDLGITSEDRPEVFKKYGTANDVLAMSAAVAFPDFYASQRDNGGLTLWSDASRVRAKSTLLPPTQQHIAVLSGLHAAENGSLSASYLTWVTEEQLQTVLPANVWACQREGRVRARLEYIEPIVVPTTTRHACAEAVQAISRRYSVSILFTDNKDGTFTLRPRVPAALKTQITAALLQATRDAPVVEFVIKASINDPKFVARVLGNLRDEAVELTAYDRQQVSRKVQLDYDQDTLKLRVSDFVCPVAPMLLGTLTNTLAQSRVAFTPAQPVAPPAGATASPHAAVNGAWYQYLVKQNNFSPMHDFWGWLAHELVHQCGAQIYGGFCHALLTSKNPPLQVNDIDAQVPDVNTAHAQLKRLLQPIGATVDNLHLTASGLAHCCFVSYNGRKYKIDFKSTSCHVNTVDASHGNFLLSSSGLTKRIAVPQGPNIPLATQIDLTCRRQFIMHSADEQRLRKHLAAGWTCISTLNGRLHTVAMQYPEQYTPTPPY